jgi:hypothetical protein
MVGATIAIDTCRLMMATASLPAKIEKDLVSYKRKVTFRDFTQFLSPMAYGKDKSINWLITSQQSYVKRLILIPLGADTGAAPGFAKSPLASSGACEPGLPTPGSCLSNIQLQISGQSYFNNPIQYGFEQFIANIAPETQGGFSGDQLSTGLVSFYDWQHAPFYVFDISRNPNLATNAESVSLQLSAHNRSPFAIKLLALIEYDSAFEIDQSSRGLQVLNATPDMISLQ